jgi:tetratricopeptide (TPR) repeat protein
VVAEADSFLQRPADPLLQGEARLLLATALQRLGRKTEAQRQLFAQLVILADWQRTETNALPAELTRTEQQAGNAVANQFYSDGDYANALELYLSLAQLNSAPEWQLPALYQAALVHERLGQWDKARELYARITELGRANSALADDSVKFLLEMAERRSRMAAWLIQAADAVTAAQPALNHRVEASPAP